MQKGVAQYMGEVVVAITGASGAIYGNALPSACQILEFKYGLL